MTSPTILFAPATVEVAELEGGHKLDPVQHEAVQHVIDNNGKGYVALDMGLGKSAVGASLALGCKAAGATPTLIVVPPSMRVTWQRELARFAPSLTVETIKTTKVDEAWTPSTDVVLMGNMTINAWKDQLTGRIGSVIMDEAHTFKEARAARTKGMLQITTAMVTAEDQFGRKIVQRAELPDGSQAPVPAVIVPMSGTPTPNGRGTEWYPQIKMLGKGAFKAVGGEGVFWSYYADRSRSLDAETAADRGQEFHEKISQAWYFRRQAPSDLAREMFAAEGQGLAVKQYKHAELNLLDYLASMQDGKVTNGQVRAEALIRIGILRRLAGLAKAATVAERVVELLNDQPGGVLVFTEHTKPLEAIVKRIARLTKGKTGIVVYDGKTREKEKAQAVDKFQSGEARVLVGNTTSAGVGLTLHGEGLNHRVIIAELPWSPSALVQAEKRLDRRPWPKQVQSEVALCAIDGVWTVDERLMSIVSDKNLIMTAMTDGEPVGLLDTIQNSLIDTYMPTTY